MSSLSPEQQIRRILGAVGEYESLIAESEIDEAIASYPTDWRLAAAFIADGLAARAIHDPKSFGLDGVMTVSWGDRAKLWMETAARLRKAVQDDQSNTGNLPGMSVAIFKRESSVVEGEYSLPRRRRRAY